MTGFVLELFLMMVILKLKIGLCLIVSFDFNRTCEVWIRYLDYKI